MQCPRCENNTHVLRTTPGAGTTRRRRECTTCEHRFTTREVADEAQVGVDAKLRRAAKSILDDIENATRR